MSYEIFKRGGRQQFPTTDTKLIRVSRTGCFLLNKAAYLWLKSESALLLFDKDTKSVAIRACSPDTEHAVTIQRRKSASRIATYAFYKWIEEPICKVYTAHANEEIPQLEFIVAYASEEPSHD